MHLADIPLIEGPTPGCVVEGRFSLETPDDPGGEPVQATSARIALFMRGGYGAWLQLLELRREPSGLLSRVVGQGSGLSMALPASINLERLLAEMVKPPSGPGRRRVEGASLSVHGELGYLNGQVPELEIQAQVLEAGLGVSFSGETSSPPRTGAIGTQPSPHPALAGSRVRADIVVPWAFLTLINSELAYLGRTPAIRDERADKRFNFDQPGLAGVALDRSLDLAYFPGRLSVSNTGPSKACVSARITDTVLELTPSDGPYVYSDGFATGESAFGPKLTLFGMGYDAWTRALCGGTTGRLETRGDCVGFVTEAWAIDAVSGRHAVKACSLDLALGETELVVTIRGEVGGLLQYSGPTLPPTLGPDFDASLRISRVFLAARGVDLLSWGKDQRQLLKGESYR